MHSNHNCQIHALFEAKVQQSPDAVAVLFEGQSLTYRELNAKSNQYAFYLKKLGVKADVLVGLCMDRSIDLLIAMLAILKAGGAYVPLDPAHPIERLLFVLEDTKAPILIIQDNLKNSFRRYHGNLMVHDLALQKKISAYPEDNPNSAVRSTHLAYVIYTSGSTGTPKGVLIEHASVVNYADWFSSYSKCKPQQRIDFSSNHTFDMAVTTSIVSLMLGLTVVICNDEVKKNIRHYFNYLEENKINIVKLTPSYLKVLLHEVKNNFFSFHYLESIILGGENLLVIDCVAWHSLYPDHVLFNEYGPTEATVAVASYQILHNSKLPLTGSVPIGTPGCNMACYILDSDYNPVAVGTVGELYIGGSCLARGYLNRPDLTQERFVKNPFCTENSLLYKTGDLCRQLPDGEITYVDRIDNQVKIRGFRIELSEIEQSLLKHPAILDAIVLAQANNNHEKQLIAYYILKPETSADDINQIRNFLTAHLPYYMIPLAFVRVDYFPLNENGKLARDALPVPQFHTNQHYRPPRTRLEKKLAEIWSEALGQKIIGIENNFFELGGYSLSAARVISTIANELGKEINLSDFYDAGTIEKLAPIVQVAKKRKKIVKTRLIDSSPKRVYPLSDFQILIWLCNNFEPNAQKINIVIRRRLEGRLQKEVLTQAFKMLFKQHGILSYRIYRYFPMQRIEQNLPFEISDSNLERISEQDVELILNESINELQYYHPWPKNRPLIRVRLFRLKEGVDEIHISMSHLIADYVSSEILLTDLSKFYLLCFNGHSNIKRLKTDMRYRSYIANEQNYFQEHLETDRLFWQDYLKDACLLAFPKEQLVDIRDSSDFLYSTYLPIPEQTLNKLQQFCAENCVSISDGLTAALVLALSSCCEIAYPTDPIFITRVKSTRDNPEFDGTIGCFLKIEAIKLSFDNSCSMVSLSKQIQQASIDSSSYQQSPSLIKIASVSTFYKKRKTIKNYLITGFSRAYTQLFKRLQLSSHVLNACGRLFLYEKDNHLLINMNVQPSFIFNEERKNTEGLFGLNTRLIPMYTADLLKADNVFDVCFIRDENQNTPYLVISAPLRPSFREQIAIKIIRIFNSEHSDVYSNQGSVELNRENDALIRS